MAMALQKEDPQVLLKEAIQNIGYRGASGSEPGRRVRLAARPRVN